MKKNIRILVVDDDSFVRSFLGELLSSAEDITIAGEAANGAEAIEAVKRLQPDLVTMDINMPVMGGLEAIEQIMQSNALPILVITDQADAQIAYSAVSRGALEVLPKPNLDEFDSDSFHRKIRMLSQVKVLRHIKLTSKTAPATDNRKSVPVRRPGKQEKSAEGIIAIAVSTGGPKTLYRLFTALSGPLPVPILIAQHIAEGFDDGLVQWLSKNTLFSVKIAEHGERPVPGLVYFSPSESHMTVAADRTLCLQPRDSKDIFVPSGNQLLASVGQVYGKAAKGIILTGMGDDGAKGACGIQSAGGVTIAQDEESSVIFGMPNVAIESGCIDQVMSIDEIAQWLEKLES